MEFKTLCFFFSRYATILCIWQGRICRIICSSILLFGISVQVVSADNRYNNRETIGRDALVAQSEVAAEIITLLKSRYPIAEVAELRNPFVTWHSGVSFESIKKMISLDPVLCELIRSVPIYLRDPIGRGSPPYIFRQLIVISSEDEPGPDCEPEEVNVGELADSNTKKSLDLGPNWEAQQWLLGSLDSDVRNKVYRIVIFGNNRREIVRVMIYETITGFWNRLFIKFQNPAPNGEYDKLKVDYNFTMKIGVINE